MGAKLRLFSFLLCISLFTAGCVKTHYLDAEGFEPDYRYSSLKVNADKLSLSKWYNLAEYEIAFHIYANYFGEGDKERYIGSLLLNDTDVSKTVPIPIQQNVNIKMRYSTQVLPPMVTCDVKLCFFPLEGVDYELVFYLNDRACRAEIIDQKTQKPVNSPCKEAVNYRGLG